MTEHNVQTTLQQDPSYLDPKRPESWGEVASTFETAMGVEELPVRLSVLVDRNRFAGLRGPKCILDAIFDYYKGMIDIDCLYSDDEHSTAEE